jgi:ferredoxin
MTAAYSMNRANLNPFLSAIAGDFELIAPVRTDIVRFEAVSDPAKICLDEQPFFPLKEFFFRKHEVILKFDGKRFTAPLKKAPKRVFFGVRRCDLNGVLHQDMVFSSGVADPYYAAQREDSLLIGFHCNEAPSEHCFCGSLDLKDFHDLMFFDRGEAYLVQVGSGKGAAFLKKFKKFFTASDYAVTDEDRFIEGVDKLKVKDISGVYDNPGWKPMVDACLSCGACTTLCPTCYCFELREVPSLQDESSERVREWSSCQLKEFTKVSGGFVYRESREDRFKHRIFHQLDYFKEKNGVNLCVGCGRCITGCPTRIDFVTGINEMKA